MTQRLLVAASIIALTLIGYFQFPGHTYLQSDTQVYAPILEHYWNPAVLGDDLLAQHPHVSFTIYDEVTLVIRRFAGLDLEGALTVQQLIFRALGILGVFLIATSLGLSSRMAVLVAAIFSLGATIGGPAILSFEYEPIPRGFAIALLLLALGFVGHGRDLAAGIAAGAAFLYQAPAGYTFWIVYFFLALVPAKPTVMSRRILGLWPMLFSVILMLFLSRLQPGGVEPQEFLGRIEPKLEELQRMRASYIWVSMWSPVWYWQYALLLGASLAAFFRIRETIYKDLRYFLAGMPVLGLLSLPASYVALEKLKWVLIPQSQPLRAVLFLTVFALVLAAAAGIKAAQSRRYPEGFLWFAVAFAVPTEAAIRRVFWPDLTNPIARRRVAIVIVLAAAAVFVAWADARRKKWSAAALAVVVLVPFFLIPSFGKVANYPDLETPPLTELARWARTSTPEDAVFLFPDAGRQLYPGIFRARALRAVYTDWKTGGQVNFFRGLGYEWWRRWQLTMAKPFQPEDAARFAALGIDYIVLEPKNRLADERPVYANSDFLVYRLSR